MDTLKEYMMNTETSFHLMCCLAKRNYTLSTTLGRNDAASVSVKTVSNTGAGPYSIPKKKSDQAWLSYISLIQSLAL